MALGDIIQVKATDQKFATVFKSVSLAAGTAEVAVWTPAPGKRIRLLGFTLGMGAASTVIFGDGIGGSAIFTTKATTGLPTTQELRGNGILLSAADRALTITRGTSGTLDGTVWGIEE